MLPVFLLCVICITRHDVAKWLFFGYAILTVFAHVVTFFANIMVFRMVSYSETVFCLLEFDYNNCLILQVARHISVVQCLHDRTRLLETKQVALATCAQAILPLVCQVIYIPTNSNNCLFLGPRLSYSFISSVTCPSTYKCKSNIYYTIMVGSKSTF